MVGTGQEEEVDDRERIIVTDSSSSNSSSSSSMSTASGRKKVCVWEGGRHLWGLYISVKGLLTDDEVLCQGLFVLQRYTVS